MTAKLNKQIQQTNENSDKLSRIKENGEGVLVELENCDFKAGIIPQLNTESFSRAQIVDAL